MITPGLGFRMYGEIPRVQGVGIGGEHILKMSGTGLKATYVEFGA